MNHAIKFGRIPSQQSSIFCSKPVLASLSGMSSGKFEARSVHVSTTSDPKQTPSTKIDMEKSFNSSEKTINVMEESYEVAYAIRSEEEGFGGTYVRNDDDDDAEMKIRLDPAQHDITQGSQVEEKEKDRNQT